MNLESNVKSNICFKCVLWLITLTPLSFLMNVVYSLYSDFLRCIDDKKSFWTTNMTLKSKVKNKYTQNQAV